MLIEMNEKRYTVVGMSCDHRVLSVREGVREAVEAAGYEVTT